MKVKQLLTKTLLVVAMLGAGVNAWADTTVGATDCTTGLDTEGSYSTAYTIKGDGTAHFTFVNHNNGGSNWENWYLYCANNDKSAEYFRLRADNCEDKTLSNTNCVSNFDWDNFNTDMNGATVDMYVTRVGSVVTVSNTITTTGSKTYRYSYTYVNASMTDRIMVWLGVRLSYLVISTAETLRYNQPYSYDFNSETHPFSYSSTNGVTQTYPNSLNGGDGNKMYHAYFTSTRTMSLSYTANTDFTNATDYVYEFDWNASATNGDANTLTVNGSSGTILTVSQPGNAAPTKTFTANASTLATHAYVNSRVLDTPTGFYHFIISANSTKGVYLTVIYGGSTVIVANQRISDFTTIASISDACGRSYARVIWDDLSLKVPAVAGVVATPTYTITAPSGTSRKFTLDCTTTGATIYWATSDLEKGADGWNTYSSEVTTSAATIYTYAEDEDEYTSEKTSFATGAGTAITLNAPAIIKTAYSDGSYTVQISSDQSDREITPIGHVIKYSVDGGETATYSTPINVSAGSTVSAYVELSGYTTSSTTEHVTAARPTSYVTDWTQDYTNLGQDATVVNVQISDEPDFTVNETNFYNIVSYGNSEPYTALNINTNVGINTASRFGLRRHGTNEDYRGIYKNWNTGYVGIRNLKIGEYIVIHSTEITASYGAVLQEGMSTTKDFYFLATATEASFSITGTSSSANYIGSITVLRPANVSVTVTSAGMATYVNRDYDLDFSSSSIKAYKVKVSKKGEATLTQVDNVPAGTPVLLYKEGGATEAIPVTTGAVAVSDNDLVAGTGAAVATIDGSYTNMILNDGTEGVGFYYANGKTVAANRAYLHILTTLAPDAAASRMTMVFADDETAGINSIHNSQFIDGKYYNLNGQRVAQPTKGLYIVNGKKVVIK